MHLLYVNFNKASVYAGPIKNSICLLQNHDFFWLIVVS